MSVRPYVIWLAMALAIVSPVASASQSKMPTVSLYLQTDGSYLLEGVRYADAQLLRGQLNQIERRHPRPNLVIVAQQATDRQALNRAIGLLQKAGVPKFGLLIEPRDSK
jgi:biopolymer transport protein ExbD